MLAHQTYTADQRHLLQEYSEARWYAAYTCSRHEKKVAEQLQVRNVDYFLPLYSAVHRWNGRRANVELPLFPGYVFVRLPLTERLRVLEIPGVANLVSSKGMPIPLPETEVERMRECLSATLKAEPYPYIGVGNRVRVVAGPLQGLEGVVIQQSGRNRFVLSVDMIMRSIAINVEGIDLEVIPSSSVAA